MFHLYILWSESRKRFYVGHSADLDDRLLRHNEGRSKATKAGGPWQLVHQETYDTTFAQYLGPGIGSPSLLRCLAIATSKIPKVSIKFDRGVANIRS